jgi:hypothetical protein
MHDVNRRSIDPLLMTETDDDVGREAAVADALDELFRKHRIICAPDECRRGRPAVVDR